MPTYEYACTECGERLEVIQSFSDDALTVCPACKGKLRKLFSPVGVVFKGSGFYKTDSRSKQTSGTTAGPSNGSADSGKSSSSSSDSDSGSSSSSTSSSSSESGSNAGSDSKSSSSPEPKSTSTSTSSSSSSKSGSDSTGGGSKVA
jgi:putative FmdB family regulatory protein